MFCEQKAKESNWARTIQNNRYMLGLIAKACPGVLVFALFYAIIGAVHSFLINTFFYKYALNALQVGKKLKEILIAMVGMLIYSILWGIVNNIYNIYNELKKPRVEAYIRNQLQKKAVEIDLICFEDAAFYDMYIKAIGEVTERAYNVLNNITNIVWILVLVGTTGSLIIAIDVSFLIFVFMPLLCTLLIGKKRNRIQYEYSMKTQEIERQKNYVRRTFYLSDFSKEMRLTQMWKVMLKRMHASISEMKAIVGKYGYKLMFFSYLFDFVFDIIVYFGSIILAIYKTVVKKNMLLGDCYVVINSITGISSAVNQIGELLMRLDANSLYIDNLRNFLEYEVKISEDENAPSVPEMQNIELRNVTFAYDGKDTPVLSNINLTINSGEKIAIVGHNGAGKSTLIKLLMRMYDPLEGEILINGKNVKEYRLSSYRDLFGIIFQDHKLFAASIAENIMLRGALTDLDKEVVKSALEKTGIFEKIDLLPKGVDAIVTKEFEENGVVFSGGEAQKISVARVFTGKHEIILMDEPTSALDPIAEQKMYHNMLEVCVGKTVIFISHRLSSATIADKIYVFEKGEIIEKGSHSELLLLNSRYAEMWHKQADSYMDQEVE